jgi:hypothetical protein
LSAGLFAFDGREYFTRMEMGCDGWHWASTDDNRAIFAELYRDLVYGMSLMVIPQVWIDDQLRKGFHILAACPNAYDPADDKPVAVKRQEDVTMGEPEEREETEADRRLAEEVAEGEEEISEPEDEGHAFMAGQSSEDDEGLALRGEPITGVDALAPSVRHVPKRVKREAGHAPSEFQGRLTEALYNVMMLRVFGVYWTPTDEDDQHPSAAQALMDEVFIRHPGLRRYDPAWLDETLCEWEDIEWGENEVPWMLNFHSKLHCGYFA